MRRVVFALTLFAGVALAQAPRIDSVSPAEGPIAGGTIVTISGANFGGASVKIDRVGVTPLSQTDGQVRLQMQRHENGYVVLSIENGSGIANGEFLYVPPRLEEIPAGFITTVAGVGNYVRTFGPARLASVLPNVVAIDDAGNVYIAEAGQHRVVRVDAAGDIHEFASGNFFYGDVLPDNAPAIGGGVSYPFGVAVGPGGNVYIGTHSPLLRMVDVHTGLISTIAGSNVPGFGGDGGPARDALVGQVTAIAADASNVYFIDWDNTRIRRIDASGRISTIAGNGTSGYTGDGGPATNASFNFGDSDRGSLAVDPHGNLFIADTNNGAIRKVDGATGIIKTFRKPTTADSVGDIRSIATDRDGNVYYGGGGKIAKLNADGQFVTVWGAGGYGLTEDGPLTPALRLGHITGMAIDRDGNIVFADDFFARVRRINFATNRLETIAGIFPVYQNENGRAIAAPLMNDNTDIAFDRAGNLLIGDFRVRRLDRAGNLQTIFGGTPDPTKLDNFPAQFMVNTCIGMDVTPDGGIDLASGSDIARVDAGGIYHRLGGSSPDCAYSGDGGAFRNARLCQPWDTARDAAGNLYIADTNNNRIRRVDGATGIITTIAGNGGPVNGHERFGQGTFCGDGGPALDACLNTPYGITLDESGNIFFTENWQRVRRIAANGAISTFANASGLSKIVYSGGFLYGSSFNRPGRYDRSGNYTPIAGTGERGFSGDGGPALDARVNIAFQASGVAVDTEGNFYFMDNSNRRVRAVRYGAVLAPADATIQASANGPAIRVTVRDKDGVAAPSVRIDFSAPSAGASCTLSNPFAITDANGVATVTCTPNCLGGTYNVTAQPLRTSSTASVSMTNRAIPCRRRSARH
jgi:sugar lactone lactonase YvrE